MTSYELLRAISAADDADLLSAESLLGREEPAAGPRQTGRLARTLLIAAVLAALLGVTAFAAGWLTPNPAVIEDSVVYRAERQTDGSVVYVLDADARRVSLTRFQTIPEDLDPAVRAGAENNLKAWEEWRGGALLLGSDLPPALLPPEGCDSAAWEGHADGSATLRYYRSVSSGPNPGRRQLVLIESRLLTPAQAEEWSRYLSREPLSELLEKYGLKRRGDLLLSRQMLSVENFRAARERNGLDFDPELIRGDGRYLSNEEIAARTEALFCHAPLFRSPPAGFDRVYWFGSGDFCLSYLLELSDAAQAECCAYVGRYDVFHTGAEIYCEISALPDSVDWNCTAADGTVLRVLQSGTDAVLCAFLPDSYFCEHVHCGRTLTREDLQQIADSLDCSAIGVG